jgi:hypothetical protein
VAGSGSDGVNIGGAAALANWAIPLNGLFNGLEKNIQKCSPWNVTSKRLIDGDDSDPLVFGLVDTWLNTVFRGKESFILRRAAGAATPSSSMIK